MKVYANKQSKRAVIIPLGFMLLLLAQSVWAELNIRISEGVEAATPVAIAPFGNQDSLGGESISAIIASDLERSGRFSPLSESAMPQHPVRPDQIDFSAWQALRQEDLAIGQVRQVGADQYNVQFFLFDAVRGQQLTTQMIPFSARDARKVAHQIADIIYLLLTGEPGAFSTRVAYVSVSGDSPANRAYRLYVADTDGFNPVSVITSREPIMSPAWSPDGRKLAYVSFENKRAAIFVQNLASGARDKISEAPGINGAPAWSPDGGQLAMTLSKDGNPDIYVMSLTSRTLRKVTDSSSIDTEPTWSRDGRSIVFTSDRGGKPQLYMASAAGGAAQRLTYDGDYNARGVFSPDGKSIAMVHGSGGDYRIAVMDMASKRLRVLTRGPADESPGFAPNGSMVLYASRGAGGGQLAAVSIDGKVQQSLRIGGGEVKQPAWSP